MHRNALGQSQGRIAIALLCREVIYTTNSCQEPPSMLKPRGYPLTPQNPGPRTQNI
jgi:hypothetical protein